MWSDKSCDVGEYLDSKNCKCWKKLVDKLVEECKNVEKLKKLLEETKKQIEVINDDDEPIECRKDFMEIKFGIRRWFAFG